MDLIFNELSFRDRLPDVHSSKLAMENLLQVCRRAADLGIKQLAIRPDFYHQFLTDKYTILDWLANPTVKKTQKDLLLSITKYPYIDEKDTITEDRFIQSSGFLIDDEATIAEGLTIAYLYQTVSVSLGTAGSWNTTELDLKLSEDDAPARIVKIKHASHISHIDEHKDWIETRIGVKLQETDKLPGEKPINIRDDHGKDILLRFSRKIVQSPWISCVINSLPWNEHDHNFIKAAYPDGKIEIVLINTDKGLGIVVQTTGTTLAETQAIAKILLEEFHDKYYVNNYTFKKT